MRTVGRKELVRKLKRIWKRGVKNVVSNSTEYMFQEYLLNCEDAISEMIPANGRLYRLVHEQYLDIDIYPTSLWDYDSLTPKSVDLPVTIPEGSSKEDQINQVKDYLPSFNVTDYGAIKPFVEGFLKKTEAARKKFLLKKGNVVRAYDLRPEDGRMLIEDDGHVLFQPIAGFNLKEHEASVVEARYFTDYVK